MERPVVERKRGALWRRAATATPIGLGWGWTTLLTAPAAASRPFAAETRWHPSTQSATGRLPCRIQAICDNVLFAARFAIAEPGLPRGARRPRQAVAGLSIILYLIKTPGSLMNTGCAVG